MRGLVIALILVAIAGVARADAPWTNAPQADQNRATALFEDGNRLFEQKAHVPALARYREAIAIWDHPLIRFNIVVALIRLDRWLEAADELDKALAYGAPPFAEGDQSPLYLQALDYRALLQRSLGFVEASCVRANVEVTLDGKPWFRCPGTRTLRVQAGEHTLAGELAGFLPRSRRVVVLGGASVREPIELQPIASALVDKYPVRRWIPYAIAAGGSLFALAGLGARVSGDADLTKFEERYAIVCPRGCAADLSDQPGLRDARDDAQRKIDLGTGLLVAGGVIVVGGVVALILNRPSRVLPPVATMSVGGGVKSQLVWRF
ncbi:MAG: hypothetical protein ABI867_26810 [Kofleriaceae bacterium]